MFLMASEKCLIKIAPFYIFNGLKSRREEKKNPLLMEKWLTFGCECIVNKSRKINVKRVNFISLNHVFRKMKFS